MTLLPVDQPLLVLPLDFNHNTPMSYELPPNFHQIKADEARHFATDMQSHSNLLHMRELRKKLEAAVFERNASIKTLCDALQKLVSHIENGDFSNGDWNRDAIDSACLILEQNAESIRAEIKS